MAKGVSWGIYFFCQPVWLHHQDSPDGGSIQRYVYLIFLAHTGSLKKASISNGSLRVHGVHLAVLSCPHWLPEGSKPLNGGGRAEAGLVVFP